MDQLKSIILLCLFALFTITMGSKQNFDYETIVIGLGAAGTAAASKLARAGRKVLALEAQDRIGGRVRTAAFGSGVVEIGAEWIHGSINSTTYSLAQEFQVPIEPQDFDDITYRSDGTLADNKLVDELIKVAFEVVEDSPNRPEKTGEYISRKITDYVRKKYPEVLNDEDFMTGFFNYFNYVILGYESADDWNDVSTSSSYEELEGNQELSWGKHGYETLFDLLLNRYENRPGIPGLTMKLNSPVTKVTWSNAGVSVETANGETYKAENVIVTVSLGVLKKNHDSLFSPPLPEEKIDAINKIAFGICDKVFLRFEKDWWKGDEFNFIWREEDRKKFSKQDSWLTAMYSISPPFASEKTLTVWFCGQAARTMESLSDDVVTNKVMGVIRQFLGKDFNIPDPVEMMRSTWYSNPYIRGAYSYDNVDTPLHPTIRLKLAEPVTVDGVNRVLFAGEASLMYHFSTVHGAVETGYREAERILGVNAK